jgi:hypothetical protein
MCSMLYFGSRKPLPLRRTEDVLLELLPEEARLMRDHIPTEHVYLVGSHSGCSCGFPSVQAEQEIEYYEGILDGDSPEREKDLRSVRGLIQIIDEALHGHSDCVLFPVWNGSEGVAPKGDICWRRNELVPEHLLFTEQFRYTVIAEPSTRSNSP